MGMVRVGRGAWKIPRVVPLRGGLGDPGFGIEGISGLQGVLVWDLVSSVVSRALAHPNCAPRALKEEFSPFPPAKLHP